MGRLRTYGALASMLSSVAVVVGMLAFTASPSAAVIPQPTTTTTTPTRPTVPRTTVPRPTTPATTATEPPTTPPAPPTTTEVPPATPSPATAPPAPPTEDEQEPEVQPLELPCVPDIVDRYYTIAKDEVLAPPWSTAGLGEGSVTCPGTEYHIYSNDDPAHGTVDVAFVNYGSFEYTPDLGYTGTDSFEFHLFAGEVGDGDTVDDATAFITITDACSVLAKSDSYSTTFETPIAESGPGLLQNDTVECQPSSVAISEMPANGTLTNNGDGGFDYTPDPGFFGDDGFTYEIHDANQQVLANAVVTIKVFGPPCVAADDAVTTPADTPLIVDPPGVLQNDFVCPDFIGLGVSQPPTNGDVTLDPDGGFQYLPDPGFVGQDSFIYSMFDDNFIDDTQVTATVLIDVTCTVALADDMYEAPADTEFHAAPPGPGANDTLCDPPAELQVVDPTDNGSVTMLGSGDLTYTPNPGFTGSDSFTYTVAPPEQPFIASGFHHPAGSPEPLATVTINVSATPPTTTTAATTTTTTTGGPETTESAVDTTVPGTGPPAVPESTDPSTDGVRVATFNASLNRPAVGDLVTDLASPDDPQAAAVAEIIQRTRPDIVLLNEFDFDDGGIAIDLFRTNYLAVSQNGADPIDYPYAFAAPVNTGVDSGLDLNHDGTVGGPDDAFGFGEFPGQYGMIVLSTYPVVDDQVRTFQNLLWATMPGARLPDDPSTPEPGDWYSPQELASLRLSSKSHWDVPIDVDGRVIHVLASHPTPPVFDGDEDRNGLRNADEIAFWADYVAGTDTSWIVDDAGTSGGLVADAEFVILGDLNSDPVDGDSVAGATQQLLGLDQVQDPLPTSDGAVEASQTQGVANASHQNDPANDTADFADDPAPGNLRADYVLPSGGLEVVDAGVFWPSSSDPLSSLVVTSSDHRLVWVDVA